MAVDAAAKKMYNTQIADQKKILADLDKDMAAMKKGMTDNKKLEPYYYLGTVSRVLRQITLYIDMNTLSERIMKIKNNTYLDTAKRLVNRIFLDMEKVVTLNLDVSLNHNREQLDMIKQLDPRQRLNLYKHIKKTIERLIAAYGEGTKWKWSFPELWGKAAIIGKNLIDFREIQSKRDPREEFFYDRQELLNMVKTDLFDASNQYRNKFEISTKSSNDLVYAVRLLEDLRRIASMTGDTELSKKCKSGIDTYKARLKTADKKKQQ